MTDRPLPPAPPPPPAPPAPPVAPPAPEPPAEELNSHITAVMGVPPDVAAQSELDQAAARAEDAQRSIPADVPTIPPYDSIVPTIKAVCLKDGIPEAEFARDFPLPIEAREKLICAAIEALTGRRGPSPHNDHIVNVAANMTTVGKMIDYFEQQHPDHPINSGAGS